MRCRRTTRRPLYNPPRRTYAVCFATDEEVTVDEAFLAVCADYDADCVLRQCVQDTVAGAMPGRVDADRLAALLA